MELTGEHQTANAAVDGKYAGVGKALGSVLILYTVVLCGCVCFPCGAPLLSSLGKCFGRNGMQTIQALWKAAWVYIFIGSVKDLCLSTGMLAHPL